MIAGIKWKGSGPNRRRGNGNSFDDQESRKGGDETLFLLMATAADNCRIWHALNIASDNRSAISTVLSNDTGVKGSHSTLFINKPSC